MWHLVVKKRIRCELMKHTTKTDSRVKSSSKDFLNKNIINYMNIRNCKKNLKMFNLQLS